MKEFTLHQVIQLACVAYAIGAIVGWCCRAHLDSWRRQRRDTELEYPYRKYQHRVK